MRYFEQDGNRLIWRNHGEKLMLTPWGPDSLRVQSTLMGEIRDERWALLDPIPCEAEIQIEDEIQLLLLCDANEKVGQFCKDGLTINVYRVESKPCEGLTAAVFYAKRNNISLASTLLKVQESLENN